MVLLCFHYRFLQLSFILQFKSILLPACVVVFGLKPNVMWLFHFIKTGLCAGFGSLAHL